MALLRNLRKRLGIRAPYFYYRQKLEGAIKTGRLAPYCGLDRYLTVGWDSEDLIEMAIAIEEYGRPVRTVGDLLRMFEDFDSEYEIEDR